MSMKVFVVPVTSYQQNCSILICEKTFKAALVDPGGDIEKLISVLHQQNATLEKIFLTHGHLDHVGAAHQISTMLNVPIEGPHFADKYWLDGLPDMAKLMGFAETQVFSPDVWLKDGDEVRFGEIVLKTIHCPGHTPGHVIFFHEPSRLAMVGDVLFQGSIGRTDFPGGDFDSLIDSIVNKLWPLGEDVQFIPGHGPTSTFGYERQHNMFVGDEKFG